MMHVGGCSDNVGHRHELEVADWRKSARANQVQKQQQSMIKSSLTLFSMFVHVCVCVLVRKQASVKQLSKRNSLIWT